nr:MAG TPA: hypothetical protein [Caudoviricetes sp.]DAR28753.1 MAG TPA: hypothetical protein [Herelleviridae sp.]
MFVIIYSYIYFCCQNIFYTDEKERKRFCN